VETHIPDGAFIAVGGFGHVRIPMALIYEIVRQKRRNLALAGKTTGPYRVISQLGLYDFDEETRRMRLIAVHPGVKVDDELAASGFELLVAGEVAETIPPTEEQKRIMHELDPAGLILGR
jgi:acyl CoA:acetate/3-ketoacid CoA transferase alpha subunit